MKIKDFIENLDKNKGKSFVIEVGNEIIKKAMIEEMNYEIKDDEIYLINSINLDFAVINLNIIRNISIENKVILIFLDDKKSSNFVLKLISFNAYISLIPSTGICTLFFSFLK